MFTETSVEQVQARIDEAGFHGELELRAGLFSETLPTLPEQRYHFVNVDCDLYEPHVECLRYFYPRMVPGGIVFFDDYHSVDYPMAGRAIDAFMRGQPEKLLHLRYGDDGPNRTKAFFIKY
jgi:predicted O-methyltransferase YrrM